MARRHQRVAPVLAALVPLHRWLPTAPALRGEKPIRARLTTPLWLLLCLACAPTLPPAPAPPTAPVEGLERPARERPPDARPASPVLPPAEPLAAEVPVPAPVAEPPQAPAPSLAGAEAHAAAGDLFAAEAIYRELLAAGGAEAPAARQWLAARLAATARYNELLTLLAVLQPTDPAALWHWRAEAAEAVGIPEQAVWDYAEAARRSEPPEAEERTARVRYLLDTLPPDALKSVAALCPTCAEGGYARLRLARQALAAGQLDAADVLLDALATDFPGAPIGTAAAERRAEIAARRAIVPGHYGLLLPLSGPLQRFGQRALRGALLGSQLFADRAADLPAEDTAASAALPGTGPDSKPAVRFSVFDTAGDPELAAQGVAELAGQGVVGILGPLKGAVAIRAAEVARRLQVPMITPTPAEGVSGGGVFRLYLREADEVARLVEFCVQNRGLRRFALLTPDTPGGLRYRNLFWDAAVALGAEITGVETYPVGAEGVAVGAAIERLTGVYGLSKAEIRERFEVEERLRVRRERELMDALGAFSSAPETNDSPAETATDQVPPALELPLVIDEERLKTYRPAPVVDFDGVFLPTSSLEAAQLAPQFPFRDVEGVVLLGTRAWNHSSLAEVGKEYVEGALFPAELHEGLPAARAFFATYRALYGEDPGVIDAYAFDAVRLLLVQGVEQLVQTSRPELTRRLWSLWAAEGLTGPLTTHPSGDIAAAPKLITVRRGRLAPAE